MLFFRLSGKDGTDSDEYQKKDINEKSLKKVLEFINLCIYIKDMEQKRYIVWSKNKIDLNDPFQRKWYIKQVLIYGRSEDIAQLDWNEVEKLLSEIELPEYVRRLWEDYFASKR